MILRHFFEPSLAQSAYLVGCAASGEALVIDPVIDIATYIDAAADEGLRITGVAETHIHADYVSGARALAEATGATLYLSGEGGPDWQYVVADEPWVRVVRDGDRIDVGRIRLDVVHTPGHTPEHVIYVVTDTRASELPLGAFTGDFLFVGDVGRPDLLETAAGHVGTTEASARRLFASLRTLERYPDHLLVWPGHGSGSACGKSLGGVPVSSLGYERGTNWALRLAGDESAFVSGVLADQPDPPMYFAEMKRVNREGLAAWSDSPALPPLDVDELEAVVRGRELIVDVRADAAQNLLPGAVAIPYGRSLSAWAGSVVPAGMRFFIVAANAEQAEVVRRWLALIGRRGAAGWIPAGAIEAYRRRGGEFDPVVMVDAVREGWTIVDVRDTREWFAGHLEDAVHIPLARFPERVRGLDRSAPVLVYCQSGVRSQVAATALHRMGFSQVESLRGGLDGYVRERRPETALA